MPSGPVISALMMSTLDSSTRRKIDESQATGKLVVNTASYVIIRMSCEMNSMCKNM